MKIYSLVRTLIGFLLLLCVGTVWGQGFQGTIRGNVQDSTGGLIPFATVTVVNAATGETHSQLTTETGSFSFPNLLVSNYNVTTEFSGFKKNTRENIQVNANSVSDVLVRMEVGAASETIVITAGEEAVRRVS